MTMPLGKSVHMKDERASQIGNFQVPNEDFMCHSRAQTSTIPKRGPLVLGASVENLSREN